MSILSLYATGYPQIHADDQEEIDAAQYCGQQNVINFRGIRGGLPNLDVTMNPTQP